VLIPAIVQLGVAALISEEVDLIRHEDYYGIIQPLIAVFCALVAPELVGRDQRTQTLSLYFSRALRREDYAIAKFAAFVTSLLVLTVLPQLLVIVGNGAASDDTLGYVRNNWNDVPAIFVSGVLLSCLVAALGLAVAAYVPRRAYATVAIAALFLLSTAIAASVFEAAGRENGRLVLLFSPFHVAQGLTFWLFGSTPEDATQILEADFFGGVYALAAVIASLAGLYVLVRRYRKIEA
jgi:ABC-2 type transport system permease protein